MPPIEFQLSTWEHPSYPVTAKGDAGWGGWGPLIKEDVEGAVVIGMFMGSLQGHGTGKEEVEEKTILHTAVSPCLQPLSSKCGILPTFAFRGGFCD